MSYVYSMNAVFAALAARNLTASLTAIENTFFAERKDGSVLLIEVTPVGTKVLNHQGDSIPLNAI